MAKNNLEERVAALEAEIERMKNGMNGAVKKKPWWEEIWGSFAGDPMYKEAMRLGREYRESLRPKPKKRKKRSNVRA